MPRKTPPPTPAKLAREARRTARDTRIAAARAAHCIDDVLDGNVRDAQLYARAAREAALRADEAARAAASLPNERNEADAAAHAARHVADALDAATRLVVLAPADPAPVDPAPADTLATICADIATDAADECTLALVYLLDPGATRGGLYRAAVIDTAANVARRAAQGADLAAMIAGTSAAARRAQYAARAAVCLAAAVDAAGEAYAATFAGRVRVIPD